MSYQLTQEDIKILERASQFIGASTDMVTTDLLYRTPAQGMRHAADMMEARDAAVQDFRALLQRIKNYGQ